MHILFISNIFPLPTQPGRGVFNQAMVAALRAAGHRVTVVVPVNLSELRGRSPWRDREIEPGVHYLRYLLPPKFVRHRYHQIGWLQLKSRLIRLARTARPDVILAFWLHPDAAIAQRLGRELRLPVVPMAGGSDVHVITADPRRREAVSRVLRDADAVLTNGDVLRRAVIGLGGRPGRVHAFRRGVDRERFRPGDRDAARRALSIDTGERILLFVGNLLPVKGPDLLLDALALVPSDRRWTVAWLGDGPMRDALEARAHAAGLAPQMRFVGRVPNDALPTWYRAADLIVLPSRSEGIPNVLLEAMACGTPFRAFDVGGVAEVAPDPAWLLPREDVGALAAALAAAHDAPGRVDISPPTPDAMVTRIARCSNR